ncbi:MAG: hypothetical protein KC505_09480 [Myxococcales bacterium]|nr:hypothetical protein [Myxococcales bacterium]USN50876.1 MAG: hypothetical protein H6731_00180 [Myxococcales bacterium]
MQYLFFILFLFAQSLFAIESIKIDFEDYATEIFFTHDAQDSFRGSIVNKTDIFGVCEGNFFYDLKNGKLELTYNDDECLSQNLTLFFDFILLKKITNGIRTRVFYKRGDDRHTLKQAYMQISMLL